MPEPPQDRNPVDKQLKSSGAFFIPHEPGFGVLDFKVLGMLARIEFAGETNRPHIHEVACHLVRESERTAILSPLDKLGRVGEPTVNAVYLALQSFGGLFMFPSLPVYRLVLPFYLGVQAFVLFGKVVYLLLLPLDFGCADHRADTVENGRADLGGGVLQLLGS